MGQDVHPQLGLSIGVMLEYMAQLKRRWQDATGEIERDLVCSVATYSVITYASSLRGNEEFLLDLFGLRTHIGKGKNDPTDPHVVAPLLERLKKGEDGERYHMLLMVNETSSGLKIWTWLERLAALREEQGKFHGPPFDDGNGNIIASGIYETLFYEVLREIQEDCVDLIPAEVDVGEVYGFYCSLRRGVTTWARCFQR
jgi:hypothetical protein